MLTTVAFVLLYVPAIVATVPYRRYCRPAWRGWMRSVLDRAGNRCNTLAKRRAAELELEGHEPMPIVFRREPRFEQILLGVR